MATSTNFRVRPLTILLIVVALVFIAAGVIYLTQPAHALPGFLPGHQAGVARKHTKHGLASFGVAVVALLGAWLTTGTGGRDNNS